MPMLDNGAVRINYRDTGTGIPLLLIAGGGLSATLAFFDGDAPFDVIDEFRDEFRCIALDLRNAAGSETVGPLEIDRPWDAHTDDQLAVLDHLGIDKFMVLGFCIGGPLIWNLLRRAGDRVIAAVTAQPSGFRPEMPTLFFDNNMKGWGPDLCARRPEITMTQVEAFLRTMYGSQDFVFTVTRDFVRACPTPVLVLPDDIPAHPYAVAMEVVRLAPNAEVSPYPWKHPESVLRAAVEQIREFLRRHVPAEVAD